MILARRSGRRTTPKKVKKKKKTVMGQRKNGVGHAGPAPRAELQEASEGGEMREIKVMGGHNGHLILATRTELKKRGL